MIRKYEEAFGMKISVKPEGEGLRFEFRNLLKSRQSVVCVCDLRVNDGHGYKSKYCSNPDKAI
jgi:hypothetical protein